jgi:outer membrane lipopolysaccharide assembly protein LptE/RlpB
MRYPQQFSLLLILLFISSCSFSQVSLNSELIANYSINYDESIPKSLTDQVNTIFNIKKHDDDNQILLSEYAFNEYNIYAGSKLRSLEGELIAKIKFKITNGNETNNREIKVIRRYKSNELNPFAEKESIEMLKEDIFKEILNEILLEVSLFEM